MRLVTLQVYCLFMALHVLVCGLKLQCLGGTYLLHSGVTWWLL